MKKICLSLVLLLFGSMLFSQQWIKNIPQSKSKRELTFFDYENAFNNYWAPFKVDKGYYFKNGVKKKAAGWKQFKRWEYDMERQVNPVTGEFPKKTAKEIYVKYLAATPRLDVPDLSNWTSLGTNSSAGGYAGVGRINCIAFHPSDNNTYWVGAASGGLWVTTNNGSGWTCLTDNNGALAVSDIIIPTDYVTSHTIYIATGDKDHWDNNSIGVLKSTDGGSTWNTTGISYALADWQMVNRLLLDPTNNQHIIAATSSGVYATTDGGTTWNTQLSPVTFIDMEYKPGDFNTLYGSTQNGEIYVTSNGGGLWTLAFSDPDANRIELAVSPNQPAWVYALMANSASGLYGVYQSTNSGLSYTQVFAGTTSNLLGWDANGGDTGGQGWYDLSLAVSPSNANTILLGGVDTWRSINGGTSWSIVNHWWGDGVQAVHADKHKLSFRSNGDLFECNDGGTYISTDAGTNWTDKTNGLVISQMYKLGVAQTVPGDIITGLQDNGTKLLSGGNWYDVIGGDGMECLIDYTNTLIQYGTYVDGELYRTTDYWNNSTFIQPPGSGDGAWVTPFIIDPTDPQTLYAGYADVWKTTDRGDNWTQISTINSSYRIRAMAIAPSNTQYLYIADPWTIWKTTNGGSSWNDITGTLPVGWGSITYIAVKNNDPNTLWVTLSGYSPYNVFQSIDGGTTWTDISAGLPQLPAYAIVQNKQSTGEVQLYVGTELGIYFKKGTDNWISFNSGLPDVKIGEIEIYYAADSLNSKLRAATYGRGLWESPVYHNCDAPVQPGTISGPPTVCQGSSNTYSISLVTGATSYTWSLPIGWSGSSASNSINATAGASGGSISVTANNSCGPGPAQNKNVSVIPVPASVSVMNINVLNGQNNCNNASQTITVAGSGTTFTVQNGGSAIMIAGQSIDYLPGVLVYSGGYMHGIITTNACCGVAGFAPPLVENPPITDSLENISTVVTGSTHFKVYPNPTTGNLVLELDGEFTSSVANVEIFGMTGEKVLTAQLNGERKREFSLSDRPVGIYFIRVITGNHASAAKIIKQ